MFTGIIQAVGTIAALNPTGGDVRLSVDATGLGLDETQLGDSIAVNGVCLTVTERQGERFSVDCSRETLDLTTIGQLKPGSKVNLEKALTLATPLGGHLVSGHVDGLGKIESRHDSARATEFWVNVPESLARYIARKGSVALDGVSLTVNEVDGVRFRLTIIPHTLSQTIMDHYQPGSSVNIEVDLIARYAERLMQFGSQKTPDASGLGGGLGSPYE